MGSHGFMGFWSDIDPDYRLRYQEWHNCEHMPERVGIPGFVEGRRYRGGPGSPTFFMCYITSEPEVLSSPAYLAALNCPTPWTQEALTQFRNPERSLYRRLCSFGSTAAHAPYIVLVRFNDTRPGSEIASVLDAWMQETGTPDQRAALYDMDTAASRIMTAERRIYSAGPGERQYLIGVELLDRAASERAAESLTEVLAPDARDMDASIYWLEMRIKAQDVRRSTPIEQIEETP